ncbi:uncharacterized protein J3D65DRAFT_103996 [Phyllosticta citribraziliensis]|uniref:Secreted peptide n=1 Tax=Phyllosticta citribraziliensis TaxID=989973 RepID=A0ABR1LEX2_9PEZI
MGWMRCDTRRLCRGAAIGLVCPFLVVFPAFFVFPSFSASRFDIVSLPCPLSTVCALGRRHRRRRRRRRLCRLLLDILSFGSLYNGLD